MGFWPFGKKEPAESESVDFASRVITVSLSDGASVRGKLVVHFSEPLATADADRTIASAIAAATRAASALDALSDLASSETATRLLGDLPDNVVAPRSLELVALHHLDDASPSLRPSERFSSASERPLSSAHSPITRDPPASSRPSSSRPPALAARGSDASARPDDAPLSVGIPTSRRPSGQLLMARGTRLVPLDATSDAAGKALVPLLRDAATKLELGIFRAYDLLAVRQAMADEPDDALIEALVPTSSAPLGLFAESRADEIDRWATHLGDEAFENVEGECARMVSFLLYEALKHAQLEAATITTVVERMSEGAFPSGKAALSALGRYLHPTEGTPTAELAKAIVSALGHEKELAGLPRVLTPLLASLQDDLAVAAAQVRGAVGKS